MVASFGDLVAYDALVGGPTGWQIDTAHRSSGWSARPLTPAQIACPRSVPLPCRDDGAGPRDCDRGQPPTT